MDKDEIIKKINDRPYEDESAHLRKNLKDGVIKSIRKKLKDEYKLLTTISIERLKNNDSLLNINQSIGHEFITSIREQIGIEKLSDEEYDKIDDYFIYIVNALELIITKAEDVEAIIDKIGDITIGDITLPLSKTVVGNLTTMRAITQMKELQDHQSKSDDVKRRNISALRKHADTFDAEGNPFFGGKKTRKRSKHKRSKRKRSKHKRSKHKRSKHKRTKHKRTKRK